MNRYLKAIHIALNNICTIISGGSIEARNKELRKMIKEVYNIDFVPHFNQDRANLKQDRDNAIKDYKAASEKAKEIGSNKQQLELHF